MGIFVKDKELALDDFIDMIEQSWTYDRLTKEEKDRLKGIFNSARVDDCLIGTYKQRWNTLHAVYYAFLMALDYNPLDWRE